jgi:hypothetical protein
MIIAMRGEIAEATVKRRALIKTIADFIKVVLHDATLTQIVDTSKRESAEVGTQTLQNLATPPPLLREKLYMKHRQVPLVLDLPVPLQLPMVIMMKMMMRV